MLRRYMRYSIETGRLPSLLGREFFRAKVTSYTVVTFEDRVIFVHDMEKCLDRLDEFSRQLIARHILQEHDQVGFIIDQAAAGALTRYRTPWLLGPLEDQGLAWDERMTRRAILWLSHVRKKAILKLTDDDYNESGLQDLLRACGSAYEANLAGFYQMQHTITGWPGGRDPQRTKPGDAPVRPLRAS